MVLKLLCEMTMMMMGGHGSCACMMKIGYMEFSALNIGIEDELYIIA